MTDGSPYDDFDCACGVLPRPDHRQRFQMAGTLGALRRLKALRPRLQEPSPPPRSPPSAGSLSAEWGSSNLGCSAVDAVFGGPNAAVGTGAGAICGQVVIKVRRWCTSCPANGYAARKANWASLTRMCCGYPIAVTSSLAMAFSYSSLAMSPKATTKATRLSIFTHN